MKTLYFFLVTLCLLLVSTAHAQIYRYQDENGKWHFSDSPPPDSTKADTLDLDSGAPAPPPEVGEGAELEQEDLTDAKDLLAQLTLATSPASPIEATTLSVVKIETPIGSGSGFFISENGYLITNKHVVRPTDTEQWKNAEKEIRKAEEIYKEQKRLLAQEKRDLDNYKKELDNYREELEDSGGSSKRAYDQDYKIVSERYNRMLKSYKARKKEFTAMEKEFKRELSEFNRKRSKSRSASRFTIVLKDDSRLKAKLVELSNNQDLALLKLTGTYKTPYLEYASSRVYQGMEVYAIGSPLGLSDYVTRGIVTRYQPDQIVTDTQILPGNSGGPLTTPEGLVVGVNTQKYSAGGSAFNDGFGIAIPISLVKEEFGSFFQQPKSQQPDE